MKHRVGPRGATRDAALGSEAKPEDAAVALTLLQPNRTKWQGDASSPQHPRGAPTLAPLTADPDPGPPDSDSPFPRPLDCVVTMATAHPALGSATPSAATAARKRQGCKVQEARGGRRGRRGRFRQNYLICCVWTAECGIFLHFVSLQLYGPYLFYNLKNTILK